MEFSIDGHDLLPFVSEAQRTLTVHRLDNEISRNAFRKWDNYRKRVAILRVRNDERTSFSPAEEREFREGSLRVRDVMRRRGEMMPAVFAFSVSELPFQIAADGHYRVRVTVERGQAHTVWEGEILIVDVEPLVTNSVWTPADLHIHSTFGGGPFTPIRLASDLAAGGYRIGYVTDEPAGWCRSAVPTITATMQNGDTWVQYRTAVRNASTMQVAMFPGAEISAAHVVQGDRTKPSPLLNPFAEHNGHALAYGIQNLTGSNTFENTGFRYNWFVPNTLLSNINGNNPFPPSPTAGNPNPPGPSSASIAHPSCDFYPWRVWSSPYGTLTARYDGFELMTGGQLFFDPNHAPIARWRRELLSRLGQTFLGHGFPSARTGSDYGNRYVTRFHEISFFTYIGLPSPLPVDMRTLLQGNVDLALRAGRTVASRLGGVASLRLRNAQGVLQEIGSRFTMPVNSAVEGNIVLRAARSGNHRVRIIENDFLRTVHDTTHSMTAGGTITLPVRFTFPGGQRFYHVIVEHSSISANDTIYTSPIFIRQ
ncbi:MAG: hypothetical protein DDT34_02482 [Firmicutes bacterium]|nr:hypothetical protein [Bacillota bacterium]